MTVETPHKRPPDTYKNYNISKLIINDKHISRRMRVENTTQSTQPSDSSNIYDIFRNIKIGSYIKRSSRILLLDSEVSFFAFIRSLITYEVESILLFDNNTHDIIGQINDLDILIFLLILHKNTVEVNPEFIFWKIKLSTWIDIKPPNKINKIDSNTSFLDLSKLMIRESRDSIYVLSPSRNYYISNISPLYILDFLIQNMKGTDNNHLKPIKELYSFGDIVTISPTTSYIKAIETLINFNIYLIPILEKDEFYGFFSRKIAIQHLVNSLDNETPLNFDIELKYLINKFDFNAQSQPDPSVIIVDDVNISLLNAISLLAKNCANKLLLVDHKFKFNGIITLTDIITLLTN